MKTKKNEIFHEKIVKNCFFMMVSQRAFDDDLGELSCDLPAKLKFDFGKILKKKSENFDFLPKPGHSLTTKW